MSTPDPQTAFLHRLNEHRGIVFKLAGAYCRDAVDREDLAQEMVAQLWRAYPKFNEQKRFSTWMYRVAVNVAISFYRRQAAYRRNVEPAEISVLESIATPAADEPDENLATLHAFIAQLDDLNRALMILYLDDNSYATIADVLGLSETNVATKIARIKQKFKVNAARIAAGEGC
jgi:RNA polymerase sigma factor (sigma-70 family)